MAGSIIQCIDNRGYVHEEPDGSFSFGPVDGETLMHLSIGKLYEVLWEDEDFYRIIDDSGEDYMYPKYMFVRAI